MDKKTRRLMGRALGDYGMIRDGDRILVAVSGGRDSLVMLTALAGFRKKAPIDFDLVPVYVDPGFDNGFAPDLEQAVADISGPLRVRHTDHGVVAHGRHNRENPCFLCARLRRKTLFEMAGELGCARIALGHNKDDIIETLFINMFFSGRLGTMRPCQPFFNGRITVIRPLSYIEKDDVIRLSERFDLPRFNNPCPSDGRTRRSMIRRMLQEIYRDNRHIKGNIFRAMGNIQTDYLLKK